MVECVTCYGRTLRTPWRGGGWVHVGLASSLGAMSSPRLITLTTSTTSAVPTSLLWRATSGCSTTRLSPSGLHPTTAIGTDILLYFLFFFAWGGEYHVYKSCNNLSTGWEYHGCPSEVTIDIIDAHVCIMLLFSGSHLLATAKDGQANITWDIELIEL